MSLWIEAALFAVGVVLIVKGGDWFVDAASWIAEVSGIPKFIVGATIVSLATTMPEMIVSLMAAAGNKVDMAVGNAVGSVSANTGLILAISVLCIPAAASRSYYLIKCLLLLASTAVLLLASTEGVLQVWGSVLLVLLFVIFVGENLRSARLTTENSTRSVPKRGELKKNMVGFLLGAAGIVIGSRLLISSGSAIAAVLGVPERIIAITLVAIGTSLPELITTLTAIAKKQSSLSVGNILGANIIDVTLILPLCSLISGKTLPLSRQSVALDLPACLLICAVGVVPILIWQKFTRVQGLCLLATYVGYLALVL
ncbi:MAG: calcium/sodium antiporter [Intestinimonas sp.]|nr:calcium/sodium antiporter [Intestinimonas sp.]